jgi:hypothetical protein
MGFPIRHLSFGLVFAVSAFPSCAASPSNSTLLRLVPPGAQIVAGFENYNDPRHHGQLVLTTRNNRLDLADWQAIAGVDHQRAMNEVIEVASSQVGGRLIEHLLLVAGRFDTNRIFRSAGLNGAKTIVYQGHTVMLIEPFTRERGLILGTRWLIILERRIAMLGTPSLVQRALQRYLNHADIDMPLRERLSQLPLEVSSWNVLSSLPTAPTEYKVTQLKSPWARFFEGADVMIVGVRFGSKIRVHFSLHASADHGAQFFEQKSASFAEVFAPERTGASRPARLANVEIKPGHVQGSIELSKNQFDTWGDWTNNFGRLPATPEGSGSAGQ